MEFLDVDIALDKIGTRIGWIVSSEGLPALRAAVARGEFGRARIMDVTPRGVTVRAELQAA
jgi:hypothetical protein